MLHILKNEKVQLVFYALIIGLATPTSLHWSAKIGFWLFAAYLFWIIDKQEDGVATNSAPSVIASSEGAKQSDKEIAAPRLNIGARNDAVKINNWWLLLPLLIIIITRALPLIRWPDVFPLGADAAIYTKLFQQCLANACPLTAETILAKLLLAFGWPINWVLYGFHLLSSVFVGLAVYLLAKEYFGKNAALAGIFIYAISLPQFLAYFAFYWKMTGAMGLGLAALYLLERRSPLAIPVAGFAGAFHLPSFLPLGLAVAGNFLFNKNRLFTLVAGLGILILTIFLSGGSFFDYSGYYANSLGLINRFPAAWADFLKGQYIDTGLYQSLSLIYWPLAAIGLIWLLEKRRLNYLLFYFAANLIIVGLGLVYHQRFLILFDLAAIIIAGPAAARLADRLWSGPLVNKITLILLTAAALGLISYQSWFARPFITDPTELTEIKAIAELTKSNATVAAYDYLYRPFLEGLSQRKVVYGYNENRVIDFSSPEKAAAGYQLLDQLPPPVYLFLGRQITDRPDLAANSRFQKITEELWLYKKLR